MNDSCANLQLHNVLYRRTVNTISNSNLPVLKIDEHQQIGSSFGERFYNAISTAFDQGYENIITVGSDCPSLRSADINFAHRELQAGRSCLGSTTDGGTYLIAISKRFFNLAFSELPWNTYKLAEKLGDLLSALGTQITYLAKKLDIDNKTQLNTIAFFLKRQLGINIPFPTSTGPSRVSPVLLLKDRLHIGGLSRRGPPSC